MRHGQTDWNAIKRVQGQWNSDLNETGKKQAKKNGEFLENQNIECLFSSPLDRTRQTSDIIKHYISLEPTYDPRIMEWDTGHWSGFMWEEIPKNWPREYEAWKQDPFNFRELGCESYPEMIKRAKPFIKELILLKKDTIAVVSHGIIGKVMIGLLLNHNANEMASYHQANNTIIKVVMSEGNGEASHFVGGEGPHAGLPKTIR